MPNFISKFAEFKFNIFLISLPVSSLFPNFIFATDPPLLLLNILTWELRSFWFIFIPLYVFCNLLTKSLLLIFNVDAYFGAYLSYGLSTDFRYGYSVENTSSLFSVFPDDVEKYSGSIVPAF